MTDESTHLRCHDHDHKMTLKDIRWNFGVLSLAVVFTSTTYTTLQNIEASLNPAIGVYSLASITGGALITCLLAPAIINAVGCKTSMVLSWVCFCVWIASNYYPKTYILLPGSVILGLSTGLLWTAQAIYVTNLALNYASITLDAFESVLSRFFGIFLMVFQSTQIWGNLISSLVLHNGVSNQTIRNLTYCGADDCPWNPGKSNETSAPVSEEYDSVVYILLSILIGFVVIGLVVSVVFLKPVHVGLPRKSKHSGTRTLLVSTLRLLVSDLNMTLLVPFSIFIGVEQVVIFAEFTKSFVTCSLGIDWVGYTMICFGVTNTIGSPFVGWICPYVGRLFLFIIAAVVDLSVILVMLLWHPAPTNMALFFMIPTLWGVADAVWQTQTAALFGVAFTTKREPAFSNMRLFMALGFTMAYLYSNQLCQRTKLWMVVCLLIASLALVVVVEFRLKRKQRAPTNR